MAKLRIPNPFWRSRARRRLAEIFERTILDFWRPRALAEDGGYHLDWDHAGARLPRAPATLIGQSRMLYFFSRLARSRFGDPFAADAAHRGFAYLQSALHDPVHGGYFWDARDRDAGPGDAPEGGAPGWWRTKHICGQAFALIGLSEYARSLAAPAAVAAARELFGLMRRHGSDPAGGYREVLARDWSAAGERHKSLLGAYPGTAHTSGSHVHLLEAFTAYERVDAGRDVRAAMTDLAALLLRHGTPYSGATEHGFNSGFFVDYRDRMPIGHCLKEIWYRLVALERLGAATAEARAIVGEQYATLFAAGHDRADGGFFHVATPDGSVTDPVKLWWVQAEALLGSLLINLRCGSALARIGFEGALDWIDRYQADRQDGEWHAEIEGRTVKPAPKGGPWKTAYHNGRAMLDCLELLEGGRVAGSA